MFLKEISYGSPVDLAKVLKFDRIKSSVVEYPPKLGKCLCVSSQLQLQPKTRKIPQFSHKSRC